MGLVSAHELDGWTQVDQMALSLPDVVRKRINSGRGDKIENRFGSRGVGAEFWLGLVGAVPRIESHPCGQGAFPAVCLQAVARCVQVRWMMATISVACFSQCSLY